MQRNTGVELIAVERQRQVDVEGYTAERDDGLIANELAWAACYYAAPCLSKPNQFFDHTFWGDEYMKRDKKTRIRQLTVAGALIAAEIDRLQREAVDQSINLFDPLDAFD